MRGSSPYSTDKNSESPDRRFDYRVLPFPSVATPLVLMQCCRGGYAKNEKKGLARYGGDQNRYKKLLAGLLSAMPRDHVYDIRVDRCGDHWGGGTVVGTNPTQVTLPTWSYDRCIVV